MTPKQREDPIIAKDAESGLMDRHEESKNPWYRETSTLIAFVALILSIVTTAASWISTTIRETEIDHDNLRAHVEHLLELPQKQAELHGLLKDDKDILYQVNGAIGLQAKLRGELALNLINKIGPEKFSSSFHIALSGSMLNSYENGRAREFVELAERASQSVSDRIKVAQAKGTVAFSYGNTEEGRKAMKVAERILTEELPKDTYLTRIQLIEHYTNWCQVEAISGNAGASRKLVELAYAEASNLNDSPQKRRIIETLSFLGSSIPNN